jgi:hypothetical protein
MNFAKLQTSFATVAEKTGLLGTLFWWDLGHNRIDHAQLVHHARTAGLEEALLPSPVKPSAAFRRAWRSAAHRLESDLLLRQIAESTDHLVVGVVREQPDVTNLDLRYQVLARAAFDKKTNALSILEKHPVIDALPGLFAHYSAITTEDIRAMVLTFVKKSGLSIRHAGGVYFIPPRLSQTLTALAQVLRATGENTVWTLPIADLGDAGETLAELAKETLDAEISSVEAELATFDARDIEVRSSTLERRLEKFEHLRARTSLMAGALSFRADALLEKLTLLEGDVKQKLFGAPVEAPIAPPPMSEATEPSSEEPYDADVGF